jgi:hypothetical protein
MLLIAADKAPAPDPGPDPTWERAVPLAEAAIKNGLIDPSSAQIEWPYNFTSGTLKGLLGKKRAGWITCGWVNAKNRMGGYTGKVWFLVMINAGVVTEAEIGTTDGVDVASATCPNLVKQGFLKPAPAAVPAPVPRSTPPLSAEAYTAAATASAQAAAARGGVGISFLPTPYGAMLSAVAPGSPAETANLKPGEVIESINGISIKGFDSATIVKILAGTSGDVVFGVVGVGPVTVRRPAK